MNDGLRLGMFLGGLLMAMVPITLTVGAGIWALRRHRRDRREAAGPESPIQGGSPWP